MFMRFSVLVRIAAISLQRSGRGPVLFFFRGKGGKRHLFVCSSSSSHTNRILATRCLSCSSHLFFAPLYFLPLYHVPTKVSLPTHRTSDASGRGSSEPRGHKICSRNRCTGNTGLFTHLRAILSFLFLSRSLLTFLWFLVLRFLNFHQWRASYSLGRSCCSYNLVIPFRKGLCHRGRSPCRAHVTGGKPT